MNRTIIVDPLCSVFPRKVFHIANKVYDITTSLEINTIYTCCNVVYKTLAVITWLYIESLDLECIEVHQSTDDVMFYCFLSFYLVSISIHKAPDLQERLRALKDTQYNANIPVENFEKCSDFSEAYPLTK